MPEETQPSTSPAGNEKPNSGPSKLIVIMSIVNTLVTVGIAAVVFLSHQKQTAQPSIQDIVAGQAKGAEHGAKASAHGEKAEGHGEGHGGGHGGAEAAPSEEALTDTGKIIPLDPFTVNLVTGVGTHPRYVRMNISMELEPGVTDKEFEVKLPRIRDTVINLLNSRRASEINSVEDRELLKKEILRNVNVFMVQSKVKGIYFTNFAISN